MQPLKQELEARGLSYQSSNDDLFEKFDNGGEVCYTGFDPTADSLHLGNFVGFMVAVHMMRRGNKYIALTGGATGMIGDPGGKDAERTFLSEADLEKNQEAISNQITSIIHNLKKFTGENFEFDFVNNKNFYTGMGYLDFLREVGKYITINNMIAKDTVKKRVEDPSQSISYTEFSYMLLQGYDFYRLNQDQNVTLQMGGQDQWGNLVTGVEITRKKSDKEVYAMTWPLITDASGKKFGKSEGNAIWLDKDKTSPYEIYQYFMNTADDDIARFLKILTLVEVSEIESLVKEHLESPEQRKGQKLLAFKVVEIIHGTYEAELAERITAFLFSADDKMGTLKTLSNDELSTFQNAMGGVDYSEQNLFELLIESGLVKSGSDARQAIQSGAIMINGEKISDAKYDFTGDFVDNNFLLLQKGKKNLRLILK